MSKRNKGVLGIDPESELMRVPVKLVNDLIQKVN